MDSQRVTLLTAACSPGLQALDGQEDTEDSSFDHPASRAITIEGPSGVDNLNRRSLLPSTGPALDNYRWSEAFECYTPAMAMRPIDTSKG